MNRSFAVLLSLIAIAAINGCSSSVSSPTQSPTANLPGPGSTFTYTYTSVDTNGVTSAPSDSTYTIVSDTLTFAGKTDVLEVQSQGGQISYYHLESNGDISIYFDPSSFVTGGLPIPLPVSSNWFVIPIGSGLEQTQTLFDSTISVPLSGSNTPVDVSIQTDAKSLGAATISAAGSSFSCQEGSIAVTLTATTSLFGISAPVLSAVQTSTIWYSKSLKYCPRRTDGTAITSLIIGNSTSSDNFILNAYTE